MSERPPLRPRTYETTPDPPSAQTCRTIGASALSTNCDIPESLRDIVPNWGCPAYRLEMRLHREALEAAS